MLRWILRIFLQLLAYSSWMSPPTDAPPPNQSSAASKHFKKTNNINNNNNHIQSDPGNTGKREGTSSQPQRNRQRKQAARERYAAFAAEAAAERRVEEGGGGAGAGAGSDPVAKKKVVNLSRRQIGANWQQQSAGTMRPDPKEPTPPKHPPRTSNGVEITKRIAMDCEMVGVGFQAKNHMVARVSLVNEMGHILMDRYVKPREPVVDYRTAVSGIRPKDIINGDDFERVQRDVQALLFNRVLVGHAVYNDLRVLQLQHPMRMVRDTSSYRPLVNRVTGGATPSLKVLARCVLNEDIQSGEHSSVEDARAVMRIYNRYREEWERNVRRRNH